MFLQCFRHIWPTVLKTYVKKWAWTILWHVRKQDARKMRAADKKNRKERDSVWPKNTGNKNGQQKIAGDHAQNSEKKFWMFW